MLIGDIIRRAAMKTAWGDKVGVVFGDTELTFREINEQANQFANALLELGLKKGDRVGLLETNCIEYVISYWAVAKAGGILVPVNYWYKPAVDIEEDDTYLILYTSGTTGFPKGVMHHHRSYFLLAAASVKEGGMDETDIYLNVYPMFQWGALPASGRRLTSARRW